MLGSRLTGPSCSPAHGNSYVVDLFAFAMQMPCRLFYFAWQICRWVICSDNYWAYGAPEEIRT